MSQQSLTNEGLRELIREISLQIQETSLQMKETDRQIQETGLQMKETDQQFKELKQLFEKRDAAFKLSMQETAQRFKETEQLFKERDAALERKMKETDKKISALGTRIGEIVENMLGGRILDKFRALGYSVDDYTRNHEFRLSKLGIKGEVDLMLHDGNITILIEVKTSLEIADIRDHIERMEKYRRYTDVMGAKGLMDSSIQYIGAVAGAIVKNNVADFAHENGLYTIVQSGEAVEILPVPENFQARLW